MSMKDDPPAAAVAAAAAPPTGQAKGGNSAENEWQQQAARTMTRRDEAEQTFSTTPAVVQGSRRDQNNSASMASETIPVRPHFRSKPQVSCRDQNTSERKPSDALPVRPHFKDQVRGEADSYTRRVLLEQGDSSFLLAQSVHIVVDDEHLAPDPPATNTQPAEVLPTYPYGICAIVDTFKNQPDGTANSNPPAPISGTKGEDPDAMTSEISPEPTEGGSNSQQITLRKHMIWAGSFLLAVMVISVAVSVIMTIDGGSDASTESTEDRAPDSEIKLVPSDGATGDWFGSSVAIDENIIVIGASEFYKIDNGGGSAYVYTHSGTVWTEQAKLTASESSEYDHFGGSVAIDGDTIVIGARSDDTVNGTDSGSAYVFMLSGTVWTEQAKLTASDGAESDNFGSRVAINGDTIVIGAPLDYTESDISSGSAYVYTLSGSVWTEQAKLTASDGAESDYFGFGVAINGDTIVIGASFDGTENSDFNGSAYVYTRSGTVWTEQTKLTASDGMADAFFGRIVTIDEDTIVIGARGDDTEDGEDIGSAYVYTRSGTVWTEQMKLKASDGAQDDGFGISVAIDGGTIAIGASWGDTERGTNKGGTYVYTLTGTVWTEQTKLTSSDGSEGDEFGVSVAIDGDTIVIGANGDETENDDSGSAYIFE